MVKRVFLILMCLTVVGCAGVKPVGKLADAAAGSSATQVVQATDLPPPDRADVLELNRPYLIGPFDKLVIDVFGIEDLSKKEVQTDAGGRISFPLAGIVEAAGKTPGELEQILTERLRASFVRNPQVTVNLKETVSQVITVDGQVKEPGLYPVIGRMTLMRAIARAKGVDEFAKLDDVVVFRTVKSQKLAALYNLKAIRRGYYDDPEVFANDVVVVGDSSARRIFKDALQIVPLLTTPLILLLRN
ncbi:MAG: polysaccharide biosynthesis/export family protein [Sphingomonadaceae bacterium]